MAKIFRIKNKGLRWIAGLVVLCFVVGAGFAAFSTTGFCFKLVGWKWWQKQFCLGENMFGLAFSGFVFWYSVSVAVIICSAVWTIGNYCFNHVGDKKEEKKEGDG